MRRTMRSSSWHAVLAAVLAVVLLISTIPFVAFSVKAVSVMTPSEFSAAVNAGNDISLTSDLTLSSGTAKAYSGNIDGNGHVIYLNGSAALFTDFTGTAQDLGVIANGIVNDNGIFAQTFNGTMTACFAYGKIGYTKNAVVGGMVGNMTGGSITESFSNVIIESTTASHVGGLIGTISGGAVSSCYSAGYIKVDNAKTHVGGFANLTDSDKDGNPDGVVSDTYTSCQLVNRSSKALPSGVNGLYDNQLSVVRESVNNPGLSTRELMSKATLEIDGLTVSLSDKFGVTSTAYPHLTAFNAEHWRFAAKDVIRVSVAAVAFSDIDSSKRVEPSWGYARADYLTFNSYLDKTNEESFRWTIGSANCKVYDTVPVTFVESGSFQSGSTADLLRSEFVFSAKTEKAELTVTNGDYTRKWLLSAYNSNPYFASGSTAKELRIDNTATLDSVRYYSRIGAANYKVTASFDCGGWDALDDFNGVFDGNNRTISNINIETDGADSYGLFASSQEGSQIKNLALTGVTVDETDEYLIDDDAVIGGLVGKATDTTISNVLVSVELSGKNGVGGLAGNMTNGSVNKCGVTGYLEGDSAIGGLVALTNGTTITDCYSTAAVFAFESTASDIGGLIGSLSGGSLTNSYVSALIDAANSSALVGTISGATINNSYYDNEMTAQSEGDFGKTSDMLATAAPSGNWTVSAGHYPQLTVFTSNAFKELSAVSTQRVYFQKYWKDDAANDMTTGWIAKSSGGAVLTVPSVIEGICDDGATVIAHTTSDGEGFMFEANSSSRLLALRAADTVSGGVRIIAAARDNMITLAYSVSGSDGVRSYVDIYYSNDGGTNWQGSQVMSKSKTDGTGSVHTLYDMSVNSVVKIRVRTVDDYQVQSVTIDGVALQKQDDGYYYSTARMTDTVVDVVLEDTTPEWGIRLETY